MEIPTDLFDPICPTQERTHYGVRCSKGLAWLAAYLEGAPAIALDWETNSLRVWGDEFEVLGLAVSRDPSTAFYLPVGHKPPLQDDLFATPVHRIDLEEMKDALRPVLDGPTLVFHNLKFDGQVFERIGLPVWDFPCYDTYVAAALVNESQERKLGLKDLSASWLGRHAQKIQEATGGGYDMTTTPLPQVIPYAGDDACNTLALYDYTRRKLKVDERVEGLYRRLEMPVVRITADMERRGILLDRSVLEDIHERATEIEERTGKELRKMAGFPFDPAKHEHVKEVLYDQLCMPEARKGGKTVADTKQLSLLFELMDKKHQNEARPFFETFIANRQANKIRTTYTVKLWERAYKGRIHPSFLQANTTTGRYSSRDPNFQNMPRDFEVFDIRSAFIPDPGWVFIVADYVQMEFKIAAAFSRDPFLVKAANDESVDVHTNTARAIFGIKDSEEVPKAKRQAAKTITYAVQYGASAYGVGKLLLISEKAAERLIKKFFETYKGLDLWIQQTRNSILHKGYAETYWGRRRWADPFKLKAPPRDRQRLQQRDDELRKLANMVVQGTGADFTKFAMKRTAKAFETMQAQIVGQVHDELIVLCPESEVDTVRSILGETMVARIHEGQRDEVVLPIDMDVKSSLSKSKSAIITVGGT